MSARKPAGAVNAFLETLQQALSCITDAVLNVGGGYAPNPPPNSPHIAALAGGEPVPLRCDTPLLVSIILYYRVVATGVRGHGAYQVQLAAYYYALADGEEREYIAYHWHPEARSAVRFPHLHIGPAAVVPRSLLDKAHIPTGRVDLEDIVRLAIVEFGVQPRRSDWDQVLHNTQDRFEAQRTWSGTSAPPTS